MNAMEVYRATEPDFIVSMTTYPKRFDMFKRAFESILQMWGIDDAWKIVVVLDDNLSEADYRRYSDFLGSFGDMDVGSRIETMVSDAKWRSANKLIPVYNKYGSEHPIVCFDDDKAYPYRCLNQLLERFDGGWRYGRPNRDCIVAQEINPMFLGKDGEIGFYNDLDVKLGQTEFGKYLSNACVFPKRCFGNGKLLNDYDKFSYVTNGNHDELWFWAVSTVNGVRSVGLSETMAYMLDDGVNIGGNAPSLTDINSKQSEVDGYNRRLTEVLGEDMRDVVNLVGVEFDVAKGNYLATVYGIPNIHSLYNGQKITFRLQRWLPRSYRTVLVNSLSRYGWRVGVRIVEEDFSA